MNFLNPKRRSFHFKPTLFVDTITSGVISFYFWRKSMVLFHTVMPKRKAPKEHHMDSETRVNYIIENYEQEIQKKNHKQIHNCLLLQFHTSSPKVSSKDFWFCGPRLFLTNSFEIVPKCMPKNTSIHLFSLCPYIYIYNWK